MFQPSDDYALKQQTNNNNNSFRDSDNLSSLYTDPNLNIQSHAAAVELLTNGGGVVNQSNLSTDSLSVPPSMSIDLVLKFKMKYENIGKEFLKRNLN